MMMISRVPNTRYMFRICYHINIVYNSNPKHDTLGIFKQTESPRRYGPDVELQT